MAPSQPARRTDDILGSEAGCQRQRQYDAAKQNPKGEMHDSAADAKMVHVVRVWSMPEGRRIGEGKIEGAINELDFSSDGKLLLVVGDTTGVRLFRTSDMTVTKVLQAGLPAPTIAGRISPDDQLVVAAGHNGIVQLWRFADGEPVRQMDFTGQKVETLTFSPDGNYVLYAGHDPHIRVVRVSDGALVHQSQPVDNAPSTSPSAGTAALSLPRTRTVLCVCGCGCAATRA